MAWRGVSDVLVCVTKALEYSSVGLYVKRSFWQGLPYILFWRAQQEPMIAVAIAVEAVRQWGESLVGYDAHHRLSVLFCSVGGPLRGSIDSFIRGTCRELLPLLSLAISKLFFVSIVERDIEGVHALLKQGASSRKRLSSTMVSLYCGRFQEIKAKLKGSLEFTTQLAEFVDAARDLKQTARTFNISPHPLFSGMFARASICRSCQPSSGGGGSRAAVSK